MSPRFTLVTIASGSDDELHATLSAARDTLNGVSFESIIVANGVRVDGSRLTTLRLASTLLCTEGAVHPGALMNSALERARGEYVAFLSAGATPERHWHVGAAAAFEIPEVAAVAARVLDATGVVVRACGTGIKAGRLAHVHAGLPRDAIGVLHPTVLDLAPLCGSMVRRDRVATLGGFDADFPESLFDFDWILRARMKGFAIAYRPDVTVRYDGPLALGHLPAERASAEHFLARWQTIFTPNLVPDVFLP